MGFELGSGLGLGLESSSSTASLSSAPSQRPSTPCSRLICPWAASTSTLTLQPTKSEGRLPPSTEKAPSAWTALGLGLGVGERRGLDLG